MKKFTLFFSIAAVLGFYGTVQAAYFMGLGDLPGGIFGSRAYAVSADGSVVVGGSYSSVVGGSDSSNIYKAFRWTLEEGMVSLAGVPSENVGTEASFVSADGSVVVGLIYINPDPFVFHLTKHGDLEVVAPSGGDVPYIEATGISTDGSVIVGANHANANWCPCGDFQCVEAFRWTQDGGKVGLGTLPSACHSGATGVSADGSIVVGNAYLTSSTEAFRWTEEEGMLGLGYLPGGFDSYAYAVSADGSVVVGDSSLSKGIEAFRWTQDGGMVGLGKLSGDEFAISSAYAISEDGSVVYGNSDSYYGSEVFRWTQESGMVGISPGYFRFRDTEIFNSTK